MSGKCVFCGSQRFRINRYLNLPTESSIIYEDQYVFVTPDVAPVIDGHYLIVAQEHIHSFGNANEYTFKAVEKAKRFLIENVYHSELVLFWEHGAVLSNTGGASIDHAHMHAIPCVVGFDIEKVLDEYFDYLDQKKRISYSALRENAQFLKPYISYAFGYDVGFYRCVHNIPSQFFRFLISQYAPQEYNWRLRYTDNESKQSFMRTLSLAINDSGDDLSMVNKGD